MSKPIHQSKLLVRIVRRLPLWASYIEAVRVGMDVTSFVRVKVLGVNLGIWRDSESTISDFDRQ